MTSLIYPSQHVDQSAALCYGMPHIGCRYTDATVEHTAFDDDWVACAACGATATNRHHEPPRSLHRAYDPATGKERPGALLLMTPRGRFVLRPALIALCGSGTGGCHGLRHARLLRIGWRFDTEEYLEQWLEGYLQSRTWFTPHTEQLYGYGCWHFENLKTGKEFDYRGGGY